MRISLLDKNSRAVLSADDELLYTIPDGWQSVEVVTPLVDPGNGLSSSPEAVDGVLCVWGNLSGLSTVTVNADLSFTFTETSEGSGGTFEYYFIDPTTGDTGSVGTLTITGAWFSSGKKQFQLRDGLLKSLKQSFKLALKLKL